ncbi:MAG: endo-1,4-beta-xylanase [Oscillospiraceae bacterium]|nr:endo-1,4-beta-xylanase [Oscillospiraceae bacterium]
MNRTMIRRLTAGVLSAACAVSLLPAGPAQAVLLEDAKVVYSTDFEDGDISAFSKRGDTDTSVLGTATEDGNTYMTITERSKGWNGPSFALDALCEPGVKYTVSVKVKAAWYNNCMLSLQYSDAAGDPHYSNLASKTSQGEWVEFNDVKFSFSSEVSDVSVYVECGDAADLAIDDFVLSTTPVYGIEEDIPSLKDVYADYFKIGGAVTADELAPKATQDLILKHYNSITLGNELKPENMLDADACRAAVADDPTAVKVSLGGQARIILNFCRDNNIPVRGHVLVWHSQTPDWFFHQDYTTDSDWVDQETMLGRMENYIKGVMEVLAAEYPDVDFYAWDVVNEAWTDGGTPRTAGSQGQSGSNNSAWVQVFGDNSFIPYAFEYARKYAPEGCKLYYNDFNEYMPQKTAAIVEMATELKERGLIDGIGMQSHLAAIQDNNDSAFPLLNAYNSALKKFADTGLDIQVTELDATLDVNHLDDAGFEAQAQYYSDIMDAIMQYSDSVSAVVFWGTTDDMSWRSTKYPLLFNEDYTAKPCFYSIIDGIDYEEPTQGATEVPTEEPTNDPVEPYLLGDVNMDGSVDASDASAIQIAYERTASGKESGLTQAQERAADVNGDGIIDMKDANLVLDYAKYTGSGGNKTLSEWLMGMGDELEVTVWGDADDDGDCDIIDVITVNKEQLGSEVLSAQGAVNADVDRSGSLSFTDAVNIMRSLVDLVTLPVSE